jgi:hypothetical protein
LASGKDDFRALIDLGLYDELVSDELLVPHVDLGLGAMRMAPDCRVLRPERLPLISYSSEWTFAQLKAAALLTLDVQIRALRRGLSLKDASSFNVQFVGARPVFIDTLSFTRSAGDGPWVAYRQFCEHFLGPLALIAYRGHAASSLWATALDGVALATASALLPWRSWSRVGLLMHLHLHSRSEAAGSGQAGAARSGMTRSTPGFAMRLAESLRAAVQALPLVSASESAWLAYRGENTYSESSAAAKVAFVRECVEESKPSRALDLGANDGMYSTLLAECGVPVTAVEFDGPCCERIFQTASQSWPRLINTLRVDLANPTPSFGWAGSERSAFQERVPCDLVLALALVHHLSIARHVPYEKLATFFAELGSHLIVEHVPTSDPMATRLLAARTGPIDSAAYGEVAFVDAFSRCFEIVRQSQAEPGGRTLFWMRRRSDWS